MSKVNIAILGCGRVASFHVIGALKAEEFNIVAACDLNSERLNAFGKEHSIKRLYSNYFVMLDENPEIDVVAVVTPSGMHYHHAKDILARGKSVVVEKPPVMTVEQGLELIELAKKNNSKIFPVFQYRFNNCIQRVKKAVKEGELGDVFMATVRQRWCRPQRYYDRDAWRGTFCLDGGATTNQGIHHLDLLRYIYGEVQSVSSRMETFGVNVEVEDTVVASLKFENGALGTLEITTALRPDDMESSISIIGTKGMAMIGGWATDKLICFTPDKSQEELCSQSFESAYGEGHVEIYKGVARNILRNEAPAVSFDDGLKTMRLLHSIYRSDESGEWVNVFDGLPSSRLGAFNRELVDIYTTKEN